jgi:hypothetical protein
MKTHEKKKMNWNKFFISGLLLISFSEVLLAQNDSISGSRNSKKLTWIGIGAGIMYSGALVGLNELWYSGDDRTSFHFFNDNAEWKQVDKFGHFYTAFHTSVMGLQEYCVVWVFAASVLILSGH